MKIPYTIMLFALLLLAGCNGKTDAVMTYTSPDGKTVLTITGKRATPVEAWRVVMQVKAYNFKEGKLEFEIYASDISSETVTITPVDDITYNIVFMQTDDTERKFRLIASPESVQMGEV